MALPWEAWILVDIREYTRPTCYPAVPGRESIIKLVLGRKIANV